MHCQPWASCSIQCGCAAWNGLAEGMLVFCFQVWLGSEQPQVYRIPRYCPLQQGIISSSPDEIKQHKESKKEPMLSLAAQLQMVPGAWGQLNAPAAADRDRVVNTIRSHQGCDLAAQQQLIDSIRPGPTAAELWKVKVTVWTPPCKVAIVA